MPLPATGSAIVLGKVNQAYTNTAPSAGANLRLSATLAPNIGQAAGTQISLSAGFGGRNTPYTYTP